MASRKEQVAQLLSEGLQHYGEDEIGKAIQAWRAVLAVDPDNAEALDYIQTADRRSQRFLPSGERLSDGTRRVLYELKPLLDAQDWAAALELLRSATEAETALEVEVTVELVRARLMRATGDRLGDLSGVPLLARDPGDLTSYNLPPQAGFMLSLMDGVTPLADLISLSGMDAFEAVRTLTNLLDAGIIEMRS